MHACLLSHFIHVWFFATLWTIASQAPLPMGFSKQEYRNGLPCPSPGYLPNPGSNLCFWGLLPWQEGSLPLAPPGKPTETFPNKSPTDWSPSQSLLPVKAASVLTYSANNLPFLVLSGIRWAHHGFSMSSFKPFIGIVLRELFRCMTKIVQRVAQTHRKKMYHSGLKIEFLEFGILQ